jgi:hypothetical protein
MTGAEWQHSTSEGGYGYHMDNNVKISIRIVGFLQSYVIGSYSNVVRKPIELLLIYCSRKFLDQVNKCLTWITKI